MSSDIHVLPVDDLIAHVESRGCVCRPRCDEGVPAVVVHNAADGREYFEPNHVNDEVRH
jgi:hypothetical protein